MFLKTILFLLRYVVPVENIVEIDETAFVKRKYNFVSFILSFFQFTLTGHIVDGVGYLEVFRGTNKCFMVTVADRTAETLLPIIQDYTLPGTTIISDGWAAYRRIGQLPENYVHMTVN